MVKKGSLYRIGREDSATEWPSSSDQRRNEVTDAMLLPTQLSFGHRRSRASAIRDAPRRLSARESCCPRATFLMRRVGRACGKVDKHQSIGRDAVQQIAIRRRSSSCSPMNQPSIWPRIRRNTTHQCARLAAASRQFAEGVHDAVSSCVSRIGS